MRHSIITIIIIIIIIVIFFLFPVLHSRGPKEIMNENKHELGVSQLATSHFHLKISERIGETDGIKALDRNRKALKEEKCLSWVVSVSIDSMAQCTNEVRTDLVNRTELLNGDMGKK